MYSSSDNCFPTLNHHSIPGLISKPTDSEKPFYLPCLSQSLKRQIFERVFWVHFPSNPQHLYSCSNNQAFLIPLLLIRKGLLHAHIWQMVIPRAPLVLSKGCHWHCLDKIQMSQCVPEGHAFTFLPNTGARTQTRSQRDHELTF